MTKQEIIQAIIEHNDQIKKFGINRIGLFGSYARNQQTEKSDIDIYIEFEIGKKSYDNFIGLCFYLDDLFAGKKVEVVTDASLSPYIGPKILSTIEYVPLAA